MKSAVFDWLVMPLVGKEHHAKVGHAKVASELVLFALCYIGTHFAGGVLNTEQSLYVWLEGIFPHTTGFLGISALGKAQYQFAEYLKGNPNESTDVSSQIVFFYSACLPVEYFAFFCLRLLFVHLDPYLEIAPSQDETTLDDDNAGSFHPQLRNAINDGEIDTSAMILGYLFSCAIIAGLMLGTVVPLDSIDIQGNLQDSKRAELIAILLGVLIVVGVLKKPVLASSSPTLRHRMRSFQLHFQMVFAFSLTLLVCIICYDLRSSIGSPLKHLWESKGSQKFLGEVVIFACYPIVLRLMDTFSDFGFI